MTAFVRYYEPLYYHPDVRTITPRWLDNEHHYDEKGYVTVNAPDHPLATNANQRGGWIGRHRLVLFDHAITGPRTRNLPDPADYARCHWCGYWLPWRTHVHRGTFGPVNTSTTERPYNLVSLEVDAELKRFPGLKRVVNVDHLNGQPGDDDLPNLAAACWWCNTGRAWAPKAAPVWWDRFRRWNAHIHPAYRPDLLAVIAEAVGTSPTELLSAGWTHPGHPPIGDPWPAHDDDDPIPFYPDHWTPDDLADSLWDGSEDSSPD